METYTDVPLTKGPEAPRMPKPHRSDLNPHYVHEKFVPKTMDYAKVAKKYEKYHNDNSTFNGKSLSDAREISSFYKMKGLGADTVYKKAPIIREIENNKKNNLPDPDGEGNASAPMFS